MMWYPGMTAAAWGMMLVGTLITLLFWGSVIALVVWAVRYLAPRPRTDDQPISSAGVSPRAR